MTRSEFVNRWRAIRGRPMLWPTDADLRWAHHRPGHDDRVRRAQKEMDALAGAATQYELPMPLYPRVVVDGMIVAAIP